MAAEQAHENCSAIETGGRERRAYPRYAVDCEAEVLPVSGSTKIKGRLTDLSLGGCRVVADQRYMAGILVRIEVQFQIRGIAFRIVGVTVGSRDARVLAVRFLDIPERRRKELAEILEEVAACNAAQAAIAEATPVAVATVAPISDKEIEKIDEKIDSNATGDAQGHTSSVPDSIVQEIPAQIANAAATASAAEEKPVSPPKPGGMQERRAQSRHTVDTSAKLLLVKTAISMSGRIVNLSLGGCRIRTDERFNVGIYVRVEAEFYLHGLPFRVSGVSQAILDKNTIGVRFLDMSDRRRAQLAELIAEIDEAAALGLAPGTTVGGDGSGAMTVAG
jgi:c-di-GMP-binding flagellar brake protein YcgR